MKPTIPFLASVFLGVVLFAPRSDPAVRAREPGEEFQIKHGKSIEVDDGGLRSVAISPDRQLVACCGDQFVRVFDLKSGKRLRQLDGHKGAANCVAFSPDGKWLASVGEDQTIRLWDVEDWKPKGVLRKSAVQNDPAPGTCLAFSPDSKTLASCSSAKPLTEAVWLWDVEKARWEHVVGTTHLKGCSHVTFSPDGKYFAIAGSVHRRTGQGREPAGHVSLYEVDVGLRYLSSWEHDGEEPATCVAFAPDSKTVVSTGSDNTVRLWDVENAKERLKLAGPPGAKGVRSARFLPDGDAIVSVTFEETVQLWDGAQGMLLATGIGTDKGVRAMALSSDGKIVVTCGDDKVIKIWDLGSREAVRENAGWRIIFTKFHKVLQPMNQQWITFAAFVAVIATSPTGANSQEGRAEPAFFVNSLGMKMVRLESGAFSMGSDVGEWDERPVHTVRVSRPFHLGATEVTNDQYEQFDAKHKELRGKLGFSKADDEAVVFVGWSEAVAFCGWLSKKEGKPYRLPTEAEWEYACRASTTTAYHTGERLPAAFHKNASLSWYPARSAPRESLDLTVEKTPANPWGLFDMHGNVEEWCHDWYGPYPDTEQIDPVGRADGDFRVTRGGSHSTELSYLRSATRLGTLPQDTSWLIGFRVVQGELPATKPLPVPLPPLNQCGIDQAIPTGLASQPDPKRTYFEGFRPFVRIAPGSNGPVFYPTNHAPSIVNCPNGDLLAVWYTCRQGHGREVALAASRLRHGQKEWEAASPFWDAPGRNDSNTVLWADDRGTLYHFNGLSAAATWGNMATVLRTSQDSGATWSKARLIMPEHGERHAPQEAAFRTRDGTIVVACDAAADGFAGSNLLVSRDGGRTWNDLGLGREPTSFAKGGTGAVIAGYHAAVVELKDGRLLALGRENDIDGCMPMSMSRDKGETWTYSPSPFPGIGGSQRPVLLRLREGPIFFASFAKRIDVNDSSGTHRTVTGLYTALSYDEGLTWQVKRPVSPDDRLLNTMVRTARPITVSLSSAEPVGYLSVCQAADGVIHLVTSANHYAFNLAWLESRPPPLPPISHRRSAGYGDGAARCVAFSPDGKYIASGGDHYVQVFDVENGDQLHRFNGHTAEVSTVAFSSDGTVLASGSRDKTIRLWHIASGRLLKVLQGGEAHPNLGPVACVSFLADDKKLASCGDDEYVTIWNIDTGLLEHQIRASHPGGVCSRLVVSSDGQRWAVSGTRKGKDGADLGSFCAMHSDSESLWQIEQVGAGLAAHLAFSSDGKRILTIGQDNTIRVLQTLTGRPLQTLSVLQGGAGGRTIHGAALLPEGDRIISVSRHEIIQLWNGHDAKLLASAEGTDQVVRGFAVAADGRTLATCGNDGVIQVWNLPSMNSPTPNTHGPLPMLERSPP